jgi:hypothetical protein
MYNLVTIIIYILICISILGISKDATPILHEIEFYLKIYIALYLIWRFNAFRNNIKVTDLDKKLVFESAFILLSVTILNKLLLQFEDKIKTYFNKMFPKKIIKS